MIVELAGKYLLVFFKARGQREVAWWSGHGRASGLAEALEVASGIDADAWEDVAQAYSPDIEDTVNSAGSWIVARLEERVGHSIGHLGEAAARALAREFAAEMPVGHLAPVLTATEVVVVAEFLQAYGKPEAAERWLRILQESDDATSTEARADPVEGAAER
ncbi:hypothetical protein [Actinomadura violacea]|uniref:Uncharacterized protein n=1 Tax=Actinomadura violacea TaxID=2819934 RepID=A0ABS3S8W0_9ACTN|nr:hypothetical protein [Actinomadura violacea]MBO2465008.1 hypothetical protein [Actinomadura violacea]